MILIECDLRRPKVSTYLGLPNSAKGVTEALTSRSKTNFTQYLQSFYPNPELKLKLDFLSSGTIPPNPSELLNSARFESLILDVSKKYDYVIIDSPPILPVSDASLIATHVDGVLIVTHAGKTKKTQYQGAIEAIRNVNSNVLGVSLNMFPADSRRAQDYGYKYGYPGNYSRAYGYSYGYAYGRKADLLAYAPHDQIPPRIELSKVFSGVIKSILRSKRD